MDYKYIEQLLDRYWACETSQEEEAILRAFFRQKEVPARLERYRALFQYEKQAAALGPSDGFTERLLRAAQAVEAPHVKARPFTLARRLRPLYRAAASVAIVLLVGGAAHRALNREEAPAGWDYNAAGYTDTYQSPETALDESLEALKMVQDGLKTAAIEADSTTMTGNATPDKSAGK